MDKYSDLAPWILGAMATAAIAAAIIVSSNNRSASQAVPVPRPAIGKILPAAAALASSAPRLAAEPTAPAAPPAQQPDVPALQSSTPPAAAAGQIWECRMNGQKTFSNNPCGENSSLRELGPVNTMDPTPVFRPARVFQPESNFAQDDGYPDARDYADDSYQSQVAVAYVVHRRGERTHRPYNHPHGPAPRRN